MSWETIAKINYNLSNIPYVQPLVSYERTYSYPEEFAHIIGYVAEPNKKELKRISENLYATFGSRFDDNSVAGDEESHRATIAYLFDDKTDLAI